MTPESLTADLLAKGPYVRPMAPFRLLEVTGPDAGEFLHRLCTQDVMGLLDGQLLPAAFLDAKGKLLVTALVGRFGGSFWLEVQQEQEARLAALLERYHFTEKLTIRSVGDAPCQERVAAGEGNAIESGPTIRVSRRGVQFVRTYGEAPGLAGEPLSSELAECLHMVAGFVRVGVETEPTTLALEADLDDHCSPSKGCYTGQEIVARIHTYGHTNRRLCLLQLEAGEGITAPAPLHDEDEIAVGRVMHAVPVPGRAMRLGLGYLPNDFQTPGTVLLLAGGARATVLR
jgi:tRNA-modifying protein YgfZ